MIGGFAKDVTRRYAKAFNSKTWKYRVESQGGEKWWTRVINYLDRMEPLVRIPTESQLIFRIETNWRKWIFQIMFSENPSPKRLMTFDVTRYMSWNDI